jgi:hypothetical protein
MPEGHDFQSFVQWGFYAICTGALAYGVSILNKLRESVEQLNGNMVRLLEKTEWHEKELERLDGRIAQLEHRGK